MNAYRASISERDQFETMRAVSDFIAAELPFLPLYGTIDPIAVRKGVKALDDHEGGDMGGRPYGSWTRNAHLWDVE